MITHPRLSLRKLFSFAAVCLALLHSVNVRAEEAKTAKAIDPKAVLTKPAPENIEELKAIQKQVKTVLEKVQPCTVGVQIGASAGSGVIISKDGYVLTAGHVSGEPGRNVTLILQDGKRVKGKSLGANHGIDSGLIKITDAGDWPFVEMGKSADLKLGQWCISSGHPGGFQSGRTPVVRVGRVLYFNKGLITTDCTLVGGDSGGPLFDMDGKVIGIHSRIGFTITGNVHVPVDTYRETWDRLAKGESWGGPGSGAYLGVQFDSKAKECKLSEVTRGSPGDKGGLLVGDVITKLDGEKIASAEELRTQLGKKKPDSEVQIEVQRGDAKVTFRVTLGKRVG